MITSGTHDTAKHKDVTDIESAAVYNKEKDQLVLFIVNRCLDKTIPLKLDLSGFNEFTNVKHIALESSDMLITNSVSNEQVKPIERDGIPATLAPASWNVLIFT